MSELTFESHDRILPTMEGKTVGVIWHKYPHATTQCSVCFKTATGRTQLAVKHIMFDGDEGVFGEDRILKYRRCRDCRDARRHPAPAAEEEKL